MELAHLQRLRSVMTKLSEMTEEDWKLLIPHISYRKIAKGQYWIEEGNKESRVGFILAGFMRHYYVHDGEEKTTYFYFEDHLVSSYFSALTQAASQLTIQALTDCYLLEFPYTTLLALFDKAKSWERFGRRLAEYIALGLEERMVNLLILSPEERYLKLFHTSHNKILEKIPQHLVANYLGITPVSLSRIRQRVISKKII